MRETAQPAKYRRVWLESSANMLRKVPSLAIGFPDQALCNEMHMQNAAWAHRQVVNLATSTRHHGNEQPSGPISQRSKRPRLFAQSIQRTEEDMQAQVAALFAITQSVQATP